MAEPDHVLANRQYWDTEGAAAFARYARPRWSATEPYWGIWCLPESQLSLLPPDLTGESAVELGCGTGYVSAWLARRGAFPIGVDNSARQLATARALQIEFDLAFPLLHADVQAPPHGQNDFMDVVPPDWSRRWPSEEIWIARRRS